MDTATSAGPSRRTFLSAAIAAASAGAATPLVGTALASPARAEVKPPASPPPPTAQQPDAELSALLAQVDPARLRATVQKLVSFGTRHTLSAQDDPVRGIGPPGTGSSTRCRGTPRSPAAGSPCRSSRSCSR